GVQQAHSNSLATAQANIMQGNGYKAPANCNSSLSQQQSIDRQIKDAQLRIKDREALLAQLLNANQVNPGSVSDEDILRVKNDVTAAVTAYNQLSSSVPDKSGSAAISICEGIASP